MMGHKDAWRGDVVGEEGKGRLYHADAGYYSSIVRLVAAEKGAEYSSRHLQIIGDKHEQARWAPGCFHAARMCGATVVGGRTGTPLHACVHTGVVNQEAGARSLGRARSRY